MEQTYRTSLHYTELWDLPPEHVLYREWNAYKRELPRLLREGHEGKVALVKGDTIVGLYPTHDEATTVAYQRFSGQGFLVQPIREYEPLPRVPRYC
jgi:hypothetical protein